MEFPWVTFLGGSSHVLGKAPPLSPERMSAGIPARSMEPLGGESLSDARVEECCRISS